MDNKKGVPSLLWGMTKREGLGKRGEEKFQKHAYLKRLIVQRNALKQKKTRFRTIRTLK